MESDAGNRAATELISVEALSEWLGVPVGTLYKWRERGQGPRSAKLGKRLRYDRRDVDSWIESQKTPA